MITMTEFLEATQYRVTEGSEFLWSCYGTNARRLDCDGDVDHYSANIVFDSLTQTVYQAEIWDYKRERYYRYFGSAEFMEAYRAECEQRDMGFREAFDDQAFTDLDVKEDFLDKLRAVVADEEYSDSVLVSLDLDEHEWFLLMREAHNQDITLNQLVTNLLTDMIMRESEKT
jgi:hypothetical protein